MKNLLATCAAASLIGLPASSLTARAQESRIDPRANELIQEASSHLRGLTSLRLDFSVELTMQVDGMRDQMSSRYRIAMERPNRLAMVFERGPQGATIVCDGRQLYTLLSTMDNQYTVEKAPGTVGEIFDDDDGAGVVIHLVQGLSFGAMLIADNPYEQMMQNLTSLEYVGKADLDGTSCHYLQGSGPDADWQLWIAAGEQPVPRKIVADMSKMYEGLVEAAGVDSLKMEMTIRFDNWLVNADVPAEQFAFVPPEGAEEVDSLFDDLFFEGEDEAVGHPLLGKPAPNFILALLDGGDLFLRRHTGRQIVILDFWATWCAPCVEALPVLAEVADAYKDRGVVLYAVNQAEDPETVRAFLERTGLSLHVPLDRGIKVGGLYGVQGIPQTVVIGKDGTVQVVHVGFMPGLKERLSEELDALLAGADLAQESLAAAQDADEAPSLTAVWSQAGSRTNRGYREQGILKDRATLVDGYKRSGQSRSEAWDTTAIEFLENLVLYFSNMPGAPTATELQSAGQALVDLGCKDPMVVYGLGYAIDRQRNGGRAESHLRAAVEGLAASAYPRIRLAVAASRLARFLEAWYRHDEARPFHQLAADTFLEVARASGRDRFEQQELTDDLMNQVRTHLPADIAKSFADQFAAIETLDPCTSHTVLGKYHLRAAWDHRGGGYAHTVTDEGWVGFHRELEIAREHFEEAYRLDPTRPEAAAEMIPVAMAGAAREGENELFWFERAVAAHIDWPGTYSKMLWALRPRWGGSHEAMYRFGLECMQSGRYDTDVPYQLVQALLDIAQDSDGSFDFWVRHDVYPAAAEVLTTIAEHPADARPAGYYRTLIAAIAWATGHYDEARVAIGALEGSLDAQALDDLKVTSRRILDDVAVFTSPAAPYVAEADEALRWDRPGLAVERYVHALVEATHPAVTAVLRDRLVTATIRRDFLEGDWVPLRFERGLPGWRIRNGAWHTSAPHSVKGGVDANGRRAMLVCQAPVGARFELRGRIDMEKLKRNKKPNTGIFVRYREQGESSDWQSFLIHLTEKQATIGYRFWKPTSESISLGRRVKRTSDFHLQVWDEHAALHLDGQPAFVGPVRGGQDWRSGPLFGLAGSQSIAGGYTKFENLEIRRLAEPPQAIVSAMASDEAEDIEDRR